MIDEHLPHSQGKDRDKYFIIFLTHTMWVDMGKCRANKYLQKYGTFQSEERQLFLQIGITIVLNT